VSEFFQPDRSHRPKGSNDRNGEVVELDSESTIKSSLADGRPYIMERVIIDGLSLVHYFYFDAKGIKDTRLDDIVALFNASGMDLHKLPDNTDSVTINSKSIEDAKDREIIELQAVYRIHITD
jgi:hypothetical protein